MHQCFPPHLLQVAYLKEQPPAFFLHESLYYLGGVRGEVIAFFQLWVGRKTRTEKKRGGGREDKVKFVLILLFHSTMVECGLPTTSRGGGGNDKPNTHETRYKKARQTRKTTYFVCKVNGNAAGDDGLLGVVLGVNTNDTNRLQVLGLAALFL